MKIRVCLVENLETKESMKTNMCLIVDSKIYLILYIYKLV